MSSTNKTSLGLNMWEASDKPVRQDFVNDNVIIDEKITKLNSDLTKNKLAFTPGSDTTLVFNNTYEEDGRLYIDLSLKTLTAHVPNTTYYFGKLAQGPERVKAVFARTYGNYLMSGWIDGGGYINLYNRTNETIPSGEVFELMCVVPLSR